VFTFGFDVDKVEALTITQVLRWTVRAIEHRKRMTPKPKGQPR